VILSLIAATTTGTTVESYLDTASYPAGIRVSDDDMEALQIERDAFYPDWNYTIRSRVA